jgi:hypothetical protein
MMTQENFGADFATTPEWAVMYRELGIQVVPAKHPSEDRLNWKRPALPAWRDLEHALTPDLTFERWFGSEGEHARRPNLGMLTGTCSERIFVIDLDTHKNPACAEWWAGLLALHNSNMAFETPIQTTGGGGKQMLFRAPPGWTSPTCKTSLGVDIRGQGGFAMLPPSMHASGKNYWWDTGYAPWEVTVHDAPEWLCEAIDELVVENGGSTQSSPRERTAASGATNEWGKDTDGREDKMARLIWARLIELKREAPMVSKAELDQALRDAWEVYERTTATRLSGPGTNAELLEREGRGLTAFSDKWWRACRKWDDEIGVEAAKEPEPATSRTQQETPQPAGPLQLFDFATLFLEDVVEEPDYVEPDLIGPGGFMLLAGPPKAQKSFLLQDFLVACATGDTFLDHFRAPRPLRVFYLQAEMNEKLLRRRAKAMKGLTPTQLDLLAGNLIVSNRFRMVLGENGVAATVAAIKSAFMGEAPDIIAMDPLANLFDQENESDNTQIMKFLTQRVEAIRQQVNPLAAIVMAHHVTKKSSEEIARDPFVTIRGGGALRGYYDAGIVLFRKNEIGHEREIHFELRGGEAPEPMTIIMKDGRFVRTEAVSSSGPIADLDFIVREVGNRWHAREPFAIGNQGKRLTLEIWLMQHLSMKRGEAKQTVEKLVGMEAIRPDQYDAKRKLNGWRVSKWSV